MEAEVRPDTNTEPSGDGATTATTTNHQPSSNPSSTPQDAESIYRALSTYPFHSDSEFQQGLASILAQNSSSSSSTQDIEAITLQAQCFYLSRKYNLPQIDPTTYSTWLASQTNSTTIPASSSTTTEPVSTSVSNTAPAPVSNTGLAENEPPPPYPTSFAAIVDLITRNEPIPGIEEVPKTVLEPGSSKVDKTPRRKKPWEKDEEGETGENQDGTALNVGQITRSGEGVVNILRPEAVSERNLLAKE